MRQAGVEHVVASSGTALTALNRCSLLRRFSKRMTMLFDGDPAGLRAAIRGVDIVLGEGLDVKVAVLPDGEDPDTFAKAPGAARRCMEWLAENSRDFHPFQDRPAWMQGSGGRPDQAHRIGPQCGPEHCPCPRRTQAHGLRPGECGPFGHAGRRPARGAFPPGTVTAGARRPQRHCRPSSRNRQAPSANPGCWGAWAERAGSRTCCAFAAPVWPTKADLGSVAEDAAEIRPRSRRRSADRSHPRRGLDPRIGYTGAWPFGTRWWTRSIQSFRERMVAGAHSRALILWSQCGPRRWQPSLRTSSSASIALSDNWLNQPRHRAGNRRASC